jgi:signal transduction histidine kinase
MFELLSGLVAAEESARGQLAAELHDTVAQSLALARGEMGLLDPASTPTEAEIGTALSRATDYVEDAEEQVRAVMARTRPPALRDGDLAGAVAALRDELDLRYGLRVELSWPAQPYPVPLATAITVYRFFQEALLNVVKHADVDVAQASLAMSEDAVVAVVRDAGPGFEPDLVTPERGRHVGLGLLRERARLAGGHLEVISMPAAGTTLELRLPRPGVAAEATRDASVLPIRPVADEPEQVRRGA